MPDPVANCTVGVFAALLAKLTFADAVPEVCGENTTENERLYPTGMVTGSAMPVKENSDWLTVAEETVTGPLLAVSVAA